LVAAVVVGSHLDLFLLGLPVIGYIYERFFRKITYYRVDMMCMYRATVRAAVQQVIAEITKAQSISPQSEFAEKPTINRLLERVSPWNPSGVEVSSTRPPAPANT
jgi:hypothetical protein